MLRLDCLSAMCSYQPKTQVLLRPSLLCIGVLFIPEFIKFISIIQEYFFYYYFGSLNRDVPHEMALNSSKL